AYKNTLTWWDALLFGITGIATILAAFATGGGAFLGQLVLLLASVAYLVSYAVEAAKVCNLKLRPRGEEEREIVTEAAAAVAEPKVPLFAPRAAIKTLNGHLLTAVNNGGQSDDGKAALATNRTKIGDWGKFTLVPQDRDNGTVALQTFNGNF